MKHLSYLLSVLLWLACPLLDGEIPAAPASNPSIAESFKLLGLDPDEELLSGVQRIRIVENYGWGIKSVSVEWREGDGAAIVRIIDFFEGKKEVKTRSVDVGLAKSSAKKIIDLKVFDALAESDSNSLVIIDGSTVFMEIALEGSYRWLMKEGLVVKGSPYEQARSIISRLEGS